MMKDMKEKITFDDIKGKLLTRLDKTDIWLPLYYKKKNNVYHFLKLKDAITGHCSWVGWTSFDVTVERMLRGEYMVLKQQDEEEIK